MKRRRAKTGGKPQADLLAGWSHDPGHGRSQSHSGAGLFDAPNRAIDRSAADLVERPEPETRGDGPAMLSTYTVHCYVMVCVKLAGIVAGSPREAARSAQQRFCWEEHGRGVEFVDELHEMLVDVEGDSDYSRSVAFRADLEPVL